MYLNWFIINSPSIVIHEKLNAINIPNFFLFNFVHYAVRNWVTEVKRNRVTEISSSSSFTTQPDSTQNMISYYHPILFKTKKFTVSIYICVKIYVFFAWTSINSIINYQKFVTLQGIYSVSIEKKTHARLYVEHNDNSFGCDLGINSFPKPKI